MSLVFVGNFYVKNSMAFSKKYGLKFFDRNRKFHSRFIVQKSRRNLSLRNLHSFCLKEPFRFERLENAMEKETLTWDLTFTKRKETNVPSIPLMMTLAPFSTINETRSDVIIWKSVIHSFKQKHILYNVQNSSPKERPPAWTQAAYRPPRIKSTIYGWGVPLVWDWGTPPEGTWSQLLGYPREEIWDQSRGYPPRKDMGPVEVLWDRDGVKNPPPPFPGVDRHLRKQYVPVVLRTGAVIIKW